MNSSPSHHASMKLSKAATGSELYNSLPPDHVVEADSINSFKSRLEKYWTNQDVIYCYDCDFTGTRGLPVCM